ncbi:hypothetical protein L249_1496 [Ophiocordyceps polyrhachis-furcata BCC 54312]|uniref:Deoxycytidylate deaminase n=1 Tax=Ophiocordyceps polyrhachis-furcata BCC 54312 TaxID=1330021 RepID=A0A367L4Y5_9HYPO|nr:hypothetical protein L249_1496 [Ophiocordyceps polyrhachis-furcata BCC 54312]
MLIGVCGAICSGKKTVARYLVEHHGFKQLHLHLHNDDQDEDKDDANNPPSCDLATSSPPSPDTALSSPASSSSHAQTFATAEHLLDFVTRRWQDRFVVSNLPSEAVADVLARRPFFLLLSIDAPVSVRWRRYRQRNGDISLDQFVARSDAQLYHATTGQQPLISRATVRLLNTSESLAHLYASLGKLDVTNPDRLRPGWDTYFMALASLAAQRSNCMKRRVGCVLVGKEHGVISTGYNGTPRGLRNCFSGGCPRCNDGNNSSGVALSTCLCIHAEENALLEAGRDRIRPGAVLYCDTCPCLTCSIKICQVGIAEVVYARGYSMDSATAAVFSQAGVRLRQFTPPHTGLVHLERMELYD